MVTFATHRPHKLLDGLTCTSQIFLHFSLANLRPYLPSLDTLPWPESLAVYPGKRLQGLPSYTSMQVIPTRPNILQTSSAWTPIVIANQGESAPTCCFWLSNFASSWIFSQSTPTYDPYTLKQHTIFPNISCTSRRDTSRLSPASQNTPPPLFFPFSSPLTSSQASACTSMAAYSTY